MARAVRFYRECQAEFSKQFSTLCHTKSAWEVWADFIAMSACAISNALDREGPTHDDREQQYLRTINRYSEKERLIFPQLLYLLVTALENNPDQDFLGEMFMGLGLGDHWKGQFFTPYSICRMMAEITVTDLETRIEEKGWVGINDPCCGAGALLIATRNTMVRQKLGPKDALYVAQDVDRTAALMCYLQLSLLGCAGYVVVADSLLYPAVGPGDSPLLISPMQEQEIWIMPALYMEPWPTRIQWERIQLALENLSVMSSSADPPKPEPVFNETAGGQLTLF